MRPFKIGVMSDCFGLEPREGVKQAAALGADGIQVYAVRGAMSAEAMDAAAREAFRSFVAEQGLVISALCGDLGGHGFQRADANVEKVVRSKRIVDLARDLGTAVVTTHIGVVPGDREGERYAIMREACHTLGEYARERGITFAIETGPETGARLNTFLDDVDSTGIGVNLDPANLVMVVGDDPVDAVQVLGSRIVHTHAKDGVQHQPCDPEAVYGGFADGSFGKLVEEKGPLFSEVPLGEGAVDWDAYLDALQDVGYAGFLTIERECGDDPAADIARAVTFLREKIA